MNKRLYLGVFLTGLSILMLEVAITRILSVILFYHFAFLVVSLALLGISISGFYVYLFPKTFSQDKVKTQLPLSALLFSIFSAVLIISISLFDLESVYPIAGLTLIPFFFGGLCLSLILKHFAKQVSRLYFFDLLGSGIGCILVIFVLNVIRASSVILLVASIIALTAWIFSTLDDSLKKIKQAYVWVLLTLLFLTLINSVSPLFIIDYSKGFLEKQVSDHVEFDKWNSFSRVIVYSREDNKYIKKILIDNSASTTLTYLQDINNLDSLKKKITNLPFELRKFDKTLILGPGGGQDILTALVYGNADITGVEINPIIVNDIVKGKYQYYAGDLFNYPGVKVVVDEGRSFLERDNNKYDLIQNTFVDTWAASSAGAYALSENNLYTVEAFMTYFEHLQSDGMLAFTRWWTEQPRESLRVVSLAIEALAQLGISDPSNHIMIVGKRDFDGSGNHVATMLFKKTPFSQEEILLSEQWGTELGYESIYSPENKNNPIFTELIETNDRNTFYQNYPYDIRPVTDNRPFFFNTQWLKDWHKDIVINEGASEVHAGTKNLYNLFIILIGSVVLLVFLPLLLYRRYDVFSGSSGTGRVLTYFVLLGLGFLTVEIFLMQKLVLFLGHPVYSLSVVLFSLLVFGGIGSFISGFIKYESIVSRLRIIMTALIIIFITYLFLLPIIIDIFLQSTQILRFAVSLLILLPLGVLIGMPFPLGIKLVNQSHNKLIPWIWGLNGGASVLGSVLAFILSINFGFNLTLIVGAGFYLLALVMVKKF
ncbi:class I SAM-dependent methyltransferase [Patescibacteria group bacterium]|nr:class I SAM-dependent methyltransferase [Patescibacteria group bacterium]